MNVSKFIVLGALDDIGRGSGYDIDRYLHARMIHRWTDIKRASIYYALRNLAKAQLVSEVDVLQEGAYPEKTLYEITLKGQEEFDSMQWQAAMGLFPKFYGYKLALKFNRRRGTDELRHMATEAVKNIDRVLASQDNYLEGVQDLDNRAFDERFIEHDRVLLEAERAWILEATEWYIANRLP